MSATVVGLFLERVARAGGRPALYVKRGRVFRPVTWGELARDVLRTAAALRRLGVEAGDRVAQVAENGYEWVVCDLAIQFAQAVAIPVHAVLTGEQIARLVEISRARFVLFSSRRQADKLESRGDGQAGPWRRLATQPGAPAVRSTRVGLLFEEARRSSEVEAAEVERLAIQGIRPNRLAVLVLTSGTTGQPRGVMLSQHNLASNALGRASAHGQRPSDLRLGFLPLSHVLARTCDWYTSIASGSPLALAESPQTVLDDCAAVRPTLIHGVPYFFERTIRVLSERGAADDPGALRQLLGGEIRMCCSGGAPLPDRVFDDYWRRDVPLLPGYGLTEASPVITASSVSAVRKGTVGRPIQGVEVRLAEDGEILTRGPHVMMGYDNDPEATARAVRDGWLHTGDLGELDEGGYLRITGRKKEILVTSGGKNIAPAALEARLVADPLIRQAMVVGDGRDHLAAVIVPDWDALRAESACGEDLRDARERLGSPRLHEIYRERIGKCLAGLSRYEQVRRFVLAPQPFSVDRGELTVKRTLRRDVIEANYRVEIEGLYQPSPAPSP